jgi:hypothetical protein
MEEFNHEIVRVVFEREVQTWFNEPTPEELILVEKGHALECAELMKQAWEEYKALEQNQEEELDDDPVSFLEMYINEHASFKFKFLTYEYALLEG